MVWVRTGFKLWRTRGEAEFCHGGNPDREDRTTLCIPDPEETDDTRTRGYLLDLPTLAKYPKRDGRFLAS